MEIGTSESWNGYADDTINVEGIFFAGEKEFKRCLKLRILDFGGETKKF